MKSGKYKFSSDSTAVRQNFTQRFAFIIEVVNCLHRPAEKCSISDNYYKIK